MSVVSLTLILIQSENRCPCL